MKEKIIKQWKNVQYSFLRFFQLMNIVTREVKTKMNKYYPQMVAP